MGPTNQKASGQEKKRLPPKERLSGRAESVVVGASEKSLRPGCLEARLSGSVADCIPHIGGVSSGALQRAVDRFIGGDHLVSPPLGSAPLVRAFGDRSSGTGWTTSRALAAR